MKESAIIIPVRNRKATTLACLEQLQNLGIGDWATVIVVDDRSTDGTSAAVAREFPEIVILQGNGSLWWTGAIRLGMQEALLDGSTKAIFWLNDDCLPAPGSLELLRDHALKNTAVCGGICYNPGTRDVSYSGGSIRAASVLRQHDFEKKEIACDWLNGNMVCFPREVCETIGLPEAKRLPQSYGDIDYSLRAKEAGFPVTLLTEAEAENDRQVPSYSRSWADKELPLLTVWQNLFNPRFYRYVPGMLYFEPKHFGFRGWTNVAAFFVKLILLTIFRPILPQKMLNTLRTRLRRRRHRTS